MKLSKDEISRKISDKQSSINSLKSQLIRIEMEVREISPAKARGLSNVISRLEAWQHSI